MGRVSAPPFILAPSNSVSSSQKLQEVVNKKKSPIKINTHHAASLLIPNPYHRPAGGSAITLISQMKIPSLENIQWLPRAEK